MSVLVTVLVTLLVRRGGEGRVDAAGAIGPGSLLTVVIAVAAGGTEGDEPVAREWRGDGVGAVSVTAIGGISSAIGVVTGGGLGVALAATAGTVCGAGVAVVAAAGFDCLSPDPITAAS